MTARAEAVAKRRCEGDLENIAYGADGQRTLTRDARSTADSGQVNIFGASVEKGQQILARDAGAAGLLGAGQGRLGDLAFFALQIEHALLDGVL